MTRQEYSPGPATMAHVEKDGDDWTLVLVKELRHAPEKVWQALTDPAEISEWAPYDADKNLGVAGTKVTLTTVGAPQAHATETTISRAEAPRVLEFTWGGGLTRWELEPTSMGTRLKLWAKIDRNWIAMGAAGWQICLDVLEFALDGAPIGRFVGMETMKFEGWQRLNAEYSQKFGVEAPKC